MLSPPMAGMIQECSLRLPCDDVVSVTTVLGMLDLTMVDSYDYNLKPQAQMLGITSRANTCHLEENAFTVFSSAHVT